MELDMELELEIKKLREILIQDYLMLNSVGDRLQGFETINNEHNKPRIWVYGVTLVTKTPSGRLLKWCYDQGLTENEENYFDADQKIVEVEEYEETVVLKKYKEINRS